MKPLQFSLQQNFISIKTINIEGKRSNQSLIFSKLDLQLRPLGSSQDLLRMVPGLFIGQHAGGGKAEQIFMRGFDIDHGTDFAIYVDGMPVNMTSHAHGQGYADLHFLIPETVAELEVNKGPHTAKYGDLATAGSGEFKTLNTLNQNRLKLEYGMFGTKRVLGMVNLLPKSNHLFSRKKEDLFMAVEYKYTNSYFEQGQDFNRFNIFTKYNGELNNGDKLSISLSTFKSSWSASGQIPVRKVNDGSITNFGSIDPSEGGKTARTNFNIMHEKKIGEKVWKNQVFYSRYDFELFSNFTFFLNDSINGDQIHQADNRNILGYNSSLNFKNQLFGRKLNTTLGAGLRYDNANIQLNNSAKQEILSTVVAGKLNQVNGSVYAETDYQVTKKLKLNLGSRADIYHFDFKNTLFDTASGQKMKMIISPKANLYYDFKKNVQFYAKSGFGFHSNDARAVIVGNLENTLARAFGNELGTVVKPSDKILLQLTLWSLHLQSELVYVGDEGIVEVAGRTGRVGVDLGLRYELANYLYLDLDLNVNKGKLLDEPGNANRIPLAPTFTSAAGISYKAQKGLNGNIRYRWMGDRAATEDNSIIAKGYFLCDAVVNYNFKKYQVGFAVENIFNQSWKEAQFATESKLQNENQSVTEIHFTPGTPFFARVNFSYLF
jgi:outer membrane receptor protein involved in Fe transport